MAQASATNDFWWVPVAAAILAALAAIASAVIGWWSQRKMSEADEKTRVRLRSKDHCRKQLDELYGEMLILRLTSNRLWARLHEKGTEFRLIDNIAAIKSETTDRRRRIVDQIIAINARMAELMETRASLMVALPPPDSFIAFLDHQRALATLWEMGSNVDADGPEPSFPRDLDRDVADAVDVIQARLRDLGD